MSNVTEQIGKLEEEVKNSDIPEDLKEQIVLRLQQLTSLTDSPSFLPEFDRMRKYIEWVLAIPWNERTEDNLDLDHAKKVLDQNHHDLEEIKTRIIEYVSVMKLKREKGDGEDVMRAPILCFVGLVGTGKTTIAASIAEAMNRKFARIPFGGMGDPLDLRGQSRMHAEAEPGKIIKALKQTQSKNPVILLDEIDRVTEQGRASIMGVLVELLDPKQNYAYVDHYIDFPVDLSEALFIATANNTHHISTAVLDRLEPIKMPSYSDDEKTVIGKNYMLPDILQQSGLSKEDLVIDDEVWPNIVRPLGYDAGIRTLERTIKQIARRVAKMKVEGKIDQFRITKQNVKDFVS